MKKMIIRAGIGLAMTLLLAVASVVPAHALSGSGYNNTLPYETGCGAGAYVISSRAIHGGTVSMVYSPGCGTNWVEWYGPVTWTQKGMTNGSVSTTKEQDYAGWSYSRQIYAPGTEIAGGLILFGYGDSISEGWTVTCGSTCSWNRVI